VNAALGLLQAVDIKTPDTTGHFLMGYVAIGAIFAAYLLFLWIRVRKTKHR
jgi:hypothetical protein